MSPDLLDGIKQQLLAFPPPWKEPEELTNAERIALCIAAGCKMDYRTENTGDRYMLVASTVNPVGIVKINGKFQVCESVATENTANGKA